MTAQQAEAERLHAKNQILSEKYVALTAIDARRMSKAEFAGLSAYASVIKNLYDEPLDISERYYAGAVSFINVEGGCCDASDLNSRILLDRSYVRNYKASIDYAIMLAQYARKGGYVPVAKDYETAAQFERLERGFKNGRAYPDPNMTKILYMWEGQIPDAFSPYLLKYRYLRKAGDAFDKTEAAAVTAGRSAEAYFGC